MNKGSQHVISITNESAAQHGPRPFAEWRQRQLQTLVRLRLGKVGLDSSKKAGPLSTATATSQPSRTRVRNDTDQTAWRSLSPSSRLSVPRPSRAVRGPSRGDITPFAQISSKDYHLLDLENAHRPPRKKNEGKQNIQHPSRRGHNRCECEEQDCRQKTPEQNVELATAESAELVPIML
jgi:hypothetical protein